MGKGWKELFRLSESKIWMWILGAVFSGLITYLYFVYFNHVAFTPETFGRHPILFAYVVGVYLICIVGIMAIWKTEGIIFGILGKVKQFQRHFPQLKSPSPSIVKLTNHSQALPEFSETYLENFVHTCIDDEISPEEMPEILNHLQDIQFQMCSSKVLETFFSTIVEDDNYSIEQSFQNHMTGNLLGRLREELLPDFLEDFLNQQSDFQIFLLESQKPEFCSDTLPKMQVLANAFEFMLRVSSYIVAEWCIDVYSRVYGINKNIFYY